MQQATQKQQVTGRQQVREQDMSSQEGDEHVKNSHWIFFWISLKDQAH